VLVGGGGVGVVDGVAAGADIAGSASPDDTM